MAKRDLEQALGNSMSAEEEAIDDRFAKAEAYFHRGESDSLPSEVAPSHEKVIRDGFTMPASDYALITELRDKSLQAGINLTKSEVLRAGLHALNKMKVVELNELIQGLERVKTGRPGKSS